MSRPAQPLAGRHAVVTGGGTGIGRAIATALHAAGAQVTIVGRRSAVIEAAAAEIGSGCRAITADVSQAADAPALVRVLQDTAPVDVLVNNAGTHHKAPVLDTGDDDFHRVLQTNVEGPFALTRAIAGGMAERGDGSIIFITSMAVLFGLPQVAAYTASKAALDGLVRQLAVEFGADGVRVNAIAPGFIETDMNRPIFQKDPDRLARILARTPAGTLGRVEDVAEAAVYLASPAARFVTGISLPVDGGASIGF
jgi:gluconate 5-dehydrogenase